MRQRFLTLRKTDQSDLLSCIVLSDAWYHDYSMQVKNDVQAFGHACERLLASIAIHRPLTEEERLFVLHYCKELLEKATPPPRPNK